MQITETQTDTSDALIISRILTNGDNGLSPEVARRFLSVTFDAEDKAWMHELVVKNQEGRIAPKELQELDSYIKAGDLIALLKSKARMALKMKRPS
jgi:hypothetical protein